VESFHRHSGTQWDTAISSVYCLIFTNNFSRRMGFTRQQLVTAVAVTEIFGISVLVSDRDCDEQPSYEFCGEGTQWF